MPHQPVQFVLEILFHVILGDFIILDGFLHGLGVYHVK